MMARLGFAVIAHMDPDVLLVDEALSVGDVGFHQRCEDTIQGFHDKGTSMLLVSHDLVAVQRVCHRVIWLDAGRIRAEGDPSEVGKEYHLAQQAVLEAQ